MRCFYSFLFLILFPAFCFSQRYSPGSVITLKGDTIRGFINQREWDSNPRSVSFKDSSQAVARNFNAADIKQFTVDSSVTYKSYVCKISLAPIEENHLVTRDTSSKIDTVFLQVLQTGKNVDLMSYSDEVKTRYYIMENGSSQPQELLYRVYLRDRSEITAAAPAETRTENIYIHQLNNIALKYNTLTHKLAKELPSLEYKEYKIFKVISLINGMQKPPQVKRRTTFYRLGLAAVIFGFITYMVYSNVRF
ncbi:MAG: hypothetical protein JKY70_05545 [Mucilaginibacter sp.]|nr:hypothetical protein [Mucilaginibacter sp.]